MSLLLVLVTAKMQPPTPQLFSSMCLALTAKCCKNLSFDFTDGKDLLVHEVHTPEEKINAPSAIYPTLQFEGLINFLTKPILPLYTHMISCQQ
jgi:hypothetical protein